MKRRIFFTYLLVCIGLYSFAQGTVRGKIVDDNGEDMIGVTIVFQDDPGKGTLTDFDGTYNLDIEDEAPHVLVYEYLGYEKIEATIQLTGGEVKILNFTMSTASVELDQVVVVEKAVRSQSYYMENIKKKSASTLDYMPAELMKKVGDSNVSSAIARVSGVSTNGSFFSVRGVGDRYVKTTINGSVIPTLDPFTNNLKLDLFPTSLVDNIVLTKTASPHLPGDWSAAYISVETKDYPDKFSVSIGTSVGYNAQTTFQEVLASESSSTDWLGFDNNFRDIDHNQYIPVNDAPTRYEELVALGLGDFYRNLGITESWGAGSSLGDTYFKLGLVEMGMLGPAFIDDSQEVEKAKQLYFDSGYPNQAFRIVNQDAETFNTSFADNWAIQKRQAPINFSQNFSIGDQTKLFGKKFGYLLGFRYGSNTKYDPDSRNIRVIGQTINAEGNAVAEQAYEQEFLNKSNGWTGLINTNLKLNANNSVSLLFMPNFKGTDKIRFGLDTLGSSQFFYGFVQSQFYEERKQLVYQYKSNHYIPSLKAKLNFHGSYTDGESSVPDFKDLRYFSDDLITFKFDATVSDPRRNFRYLNEDVLDARVDLEFPLRERTGLVSKVMLGAGYIDRQRDFEQFDYRLERSNGAIDTWEGGDLDVFFANDKFAFTENANNGNLSIPFFYQSVNDPAFFTIGKSSVYSGFALVDHTFTKRFRLSGGLRAEYTDLLTDVKEFYEAGYTADDPRRNSDFSVFIMKPGVVKQWNILPSANLIYKLNQDEIFPVNLRLNYSKSVARPSLREYTETIVRDFELNQDVFGNSDLKFVAIDNADLRLESYFKSGDHLSVSGFYKNFKNHIELVNTNQGFTWNNADESYVFGVELEGRKKLGKFFEFRANAALLKSFTRFEERRLEIINGNREWIPVGVKERRMFGQAPYVINGIFSYNNSDKGFFSSISYNVQGEKLVLVSGQEDIPDVYELPRHLLNFKISKTFAKHFGLSLTARNILNAPFRRSFDFEEAGFILDFDRYTYGTDIILGISYKL